MSSDLIHFYEQMLRIRLFEEKLSYLFSRGQVHGTAHFCVGQEAVAVGTCAALRKTDFVTGTHRSHGHALAKGLEPKRLMAEILGRSDGYCAGRGGTQHITSREHWFLSNGVTGGMGPVIAGIGLAYKMNKTDQVALMFFGDGALNEGHLHEAINLAAVWKLPVLFLCENNLYAMSTHIQEAYAIKELVSRASAYGIPGEAVDGNDVEAVYAVVKKYVERARRGEGAALVEARTYRFSGHSKNDLFLYRTREEEAEWKAIEPVARLKAKILKTGLATEDALAVVEKRIEKEMEEAADFAQKSPEVAPETITEHLG